MYKNNILVKQQFERKKCLCWYTAYTYIVLQFATD